MSISVRVGSRNKTSKRAKNTWSGVSYKIERTKLKISTMTSIRLYINYPVSYRHHVERKLFDGLFNVPWYTFTISSLSLPSVVHPRSFSLIKCNVICDLLAAAMISFSSGVDEGVNIHTCTYIINYALEQEVCAYML